ncbi:MAG: hypothetical protein [Bacteriophage sp.]|nr:MAG: hypothetical protein [Bacteriophage sp.]
MNWRIAAIALGVAISCALGGYWKGHHDADQADTVKRLTEQTQSLAGTLEAYKATNAKLTEIANNANARSENNLAAAAGLRADAVGLRKKLTDLVSLYGSRPASGGASTDSIVSVLAGLLDDSITRSGDLSVEAERYRVAGEQCEASYDAVKRSQALTGKR